MKRTLTLLAALLLTPVAALHAAELKLAAVFSDHMVLQREQAVPVWGWASPGDEVSVSIAGQRKSTKADGAGNWRVTLDPLKAGEAGAMAVQGKNTIAIKDVLVGEVWLASGQSNMHYNFVQRVTDGEQVLAEADPWLRQFTVVRNDKLKSHQELAGKWRAANRANLTASRTDGDSAVAYFFSRELRRRLNVPVGALHASVGATPIQTWSPGGKGYKNMIEPLAPYGIRGAIWYQGEKNVQMFEADVYADLLTKHVAAWRSLWAQGDFPFFYVQIAPYRYSEKRAGLSKDHPVGPLELPLFWEAQTAALTKIPNTGMAVIHDSITDLDNVHPANKRVPGERLAFLALAKTYGLKDVVCEAPFYREMRIEDGSIRVKFDHAGAGLTTCDGNAPTFLQIAGADRQFVPADGVIESDSLLVSHPSVPKPVAVRFAWSEVAQPNLMNKDGLPACPFRTDNWPVK